ncbi:MAG: hypothetical protein RBT11_12970 [Desulfobacterales bacterium]|jgi:hypothetical protein|nr:hypothetical protein [Desulfobacterales bacterium]
MGTINLPDTWDESTFQFFNTLFDVASGNVSSKVSMFEIGERIGLDRNVATRAAENIMAEGWAEVRTLAGDIGLTQSGIDAFRAMGADEKAGAAVVSGLGSGALLEADARLSVEFVVAGIKQQMEKGGFGFDALSELIADIRTIEAQLSSPRPKTAILRASFKSILGLLSSTGRAETIDAVKRLLA